MDMDSINKLINRKMLLEEVEEIKQKVKKENIELIRCQVSQDAAFWEQKEKYAALKSEHERLQQNMRELQMQHEALSGQLQDELRRRLETINKCDATREICDAVHAERVQCQQKFIAINKDKMAVYEAYNKGDHMLAEKKLAQQEIRQRYEQDVKVLSYKLNVMTENQAELKQFYNDRIHRDEAEIKQLRELNQELNNKANELQFKLENEIDENEKRGAYISNREKEIRDFFDKNNKKLNEATETIIKKDNDLKSALEETELLKKALRSQEEFTKTLCDEKSSLQEKLALAEEVCQKAVASNESYQKHLEDISSMKDALEKELETSKAENETLTKELDDQRQSLHLYDQELERSKNQLSYQDNVIDKLTIDLANMTKECQNLTTKITQLDEQTETLRRNLNEVQTAFNDHKNEVIDEKKSLDAEIKEKNAQLELQANAMCLMATELQNEKEQRANLESELKNMRTERETELEKATNVERELKEKVSHLEAAIREKEANMSRELSRYLQDRNEHEKEKSALQKMISDLEKRIVNVMKEASGAAAAPPARFVPEPDTDCLLTPARRVQPGNMEDSLLGGYFEFFADDSLERERRDYLATSREKPPTLTHSTPKRRRRPDTPVTDRHPLTDKTDNIQNYTEQPASPIKERRFFKSRHPKNTADKAKKKRVGA